MAKPYIKKVDGLEGVDYLNISSKTPNSIGRKLAYTATFNPVESLLGKITSLRTAMTYITTVGYPRKLLSKTKLTNRDINKIPKKTVGVINFWSIVIHLMYVRITSDEQLVESLLELDKDIVFTSFNVNKHHSGGMYAEFTEYNDHAAGYVDVISKVFQVLKTNERSEWDNKIIELIKETKINKDVSMFHGVPFEIETNGVI